MTPLQSAQAVINKMAEDIGALQTQLDNALEERDSLLQVAGSLQEMVADRNADIEAARFQIANLLQDNLRLQQENARLESDNRAAERENERLEAQLIAHREVCTQ